MECFLAKALFPESKIKLELSIIKESESTLDLAISSDEESAEK